MRAARWPFGFALAFAFSFSFAHAKKAPPAPAPDPLAGCKRQKHSDVLTMLTCDELTILDGLMPGTYSRKSIDGMLEQFAVGFPEDARRDRVLLEAGGQKLPSLRVSGDRSPKGPFQAQVVFAPSTGNRTRVVSCTGPHPGGGPDRCAAILAVLIASPR
ncbi:MAG TPA: hypothetical protein VFF06_31425 [Polyangia bacterium]|nr:hypothetical protein [Polyangia bacterium]